MWSRKSTSEAQEKISEIVLVKNLGLTGKFMVRRLEGKRKSIEGPRDPKHWL